MCPETEVGAGINVDVSLCMTKVIAFLNYAFM